MTKLIRPLFYHWRNGSDCKWIIQRMKVIPESRRREVSNHYENLFLRNEGGTGRKDANQYLNGVASEYRTERPERVIELKPKAVPVIKPKEREYKSDDRLWRRKLD